jgi:hypothetical protein
VNEDSQSDWQAETRTDVAQSDDDKNRYEIEQSSPGCAVLFICIVVDAFSLVVLNSRSVTREVEFLVVGAIIGWGIAQGPMIAIWLTLLATGLYWGVLLAFAAPIALAIIVGHDPSPWIGLMAVMLYPLPFAIASLIGLKLPQLVARDETDISGPPIRFSIRSMLMWTFIIAAALGIVRLLPRPSGDFSEVWFWFIVAATSGVITVLAVLKPGSNRFRWLIPIGVACTLAILAGFVFDQTFQESLIKSLIAIVHVLFVTWFLSFYRRAGYRAVWRRGYYPEPVRKVAREPVNPLAD